MQYQRATQLAVATLAARTRGKRHGTAVAWAAGKLEASLDVTPHICSSQGAAICTSYTGAGSGAQMVSKGIACVLVFSVMPPHLRGYISICAFGWMSHSAVSQWAPCWNSTIRATLPAMSAGCGRREREREMLPTSSQKGLSRVGHERPLNTNSCADQPTNNRRFFESCIEGIRHR